MDDLISRQEAVKEARELFELGGCYCDRPSIVGMLNSLPPAHPAEGVKKIVYGEWTEKTVETGKHGIEEWQSARCSVCGRYHTTPYMYYFSDYAFCPNCGADMRHGDDGE